jgi:hypothetical protein
MPPILLPSAHPRQGGGISTTMRAIAVARRRILEYFTNQLVNFVAGGLFSKPLLD